MLLLENTARDYAWGAVDGLAALVGTEPTGGPEAELWIGAHPGAPSHLDDGRSLDEVIDADPAALLGEDLARRFGARLPFLLKVLAIGGPLSIQLHPSPGQAEEGWRREEAAGVPSDDPARTYRDPYAKPEVLVALEPTDVLVGFRTGAGAAAALRSLGDPAVAELAALVAGEPDARRALERLLDSADGDRAHLAACAARAGADVAGDGTDPQTPDAGDLRADEPPLARALAWTRRLAEAFPGDPTALAPLVLQLRRLAPGEGVFLPAGVPHAYLRGAGVELMAASDNVVRGGLTPKHVDRVELARLLAPPGAGALLLPGTDEGPGVQAYRPPVPEIALRRIDLDGMPRPAPGEEPGPALVLATAGDVRVVVGRADGDGPDGRVGAEASGGGALELGAGRAVLVPPSERARCRLEGRGTAWWATVGSDLGPLRSGSTTADPRPVA